MFTENSEILRQRRLWAELGHTPKAFVLYGGTVLASPLKHRRSEDFDFFANEVFQPSSLLIWVSYLKQGEITQSQENTLTAIVDQKAR